eukprot:3378255-Rhodomonas_salina.2
MVKEFALASSGSASPSDGMWVEVSVYCKLQCPAPLRCTTLIPSRSGHVNDDTEPLTRSDNHHGDTELSESTELVNFLVHTTRMQMRGLRSKLLGFKFPPRVLSGE